MIRDRADSSSAFHTYNDTCLSGSNAPFVLRLDALVEQNCIVNASGTVALGDTRAVCKDDDKGMVAVAGKTCVAAAPPRVMCVFLPFTQ